MKTKQTKTKAEKANQSPVTVYPRIPTADAKASFHKKVAKTDESNPALDAFLLVMNHFTTNTKSWTRPDVHYFSRPYALERDVVEDLLTKFIEHFHALGKIEIVEGCYSDPIFINV